MKKSGFVVAVLVIVAIGLLSWYVFGRKDGVDADLVNRHAVGDSPAADSSGLGFGVYDSTSGTRSRDGSDVTTVSYAPAPSFAKLDIHEVPLGTILDYAVEVVEYDQSRANGTSLPRNSRGQGPFVTVTPAEGVWGMTSATMGEGHIVARIESDGDYLDLGLVSGLNYLWVGKDPNGKLEWVLVPATAFAPMKDLSDREARRLFNQHAEVSIIPAAIRDF